MNKPKQGWGQPLGQTKTSNGKPCFSNEHVFKETPISFHLTKVKCVKCGKNWIER